MRSCKNNVTDCAPADSPAITIFLLSPPKYFILLYTHSIANN